MAVNTGQGSHPLTGTANLPNVVVAFPGSHWSDAVASGRAITPGEAVIVTNSAGTLAVRPVGVGDATDPRVCIALRTIDTPDLNPGSQYNPALGPNEIKNLPIAVGEYVHRYESGSFVLTLVDPGYTYNPGDLVGWKVSATRPAGKGSGGAWAPKANADVAIDWLEVQVVRKASNGDYILTVKDPHHSG